MKAADLAAAAARVAVSGHPAAPQISAWLSDRAQQLATRETVWTQCQLTPDEQARLTHTGWEHEIAVVETLTRTAVGA
jgi:hypothetical protein